MINLLSANDVEEIMEYVYENENGSMLILNPNVFRDMSIVRYMIFHTRLVCIAEKNIKIDKLLAVLTPEENSPDCSLYLIAAYNEGEFIDNAIDILKEIFGDKYKKIKVLSSQIATNSIDKQFKNLDFQLELEINNVNGQKSVYSRFL